MLSYKLRDEAALQYRYTTYMLVGLDHTTDGQLDEIEKYGYMMMTPQEAWAEIWVRIKNPFQLIGLFIRKAARMWGSMDTSFYFYTDYTNNTPFQHMVASAFGALDGLYIAATYLLAAAGLFLSRNMNRALALPLIVLTGWFSIFLFSEIQPRYRYYGMIFVILFAAVGCYMLWKRYLEKEAHTMPLIYTLYMVLAPCEKALKKSRYKLNTGKPELKQSGRITASTFW